jgi:predicted RNase H-like HicB family nuclease
MNKSVHDYLSLPYTWEVIPSTEGGWLVKVKELRGCMTQSDSWEAIPALIREACGAGLKSHSNLAIR